MGNLGVNIALPTIAAIVALVLLRPAIRDRAFWRATVTPLASIIGSGFLVLAPLLALVVGGAAPWAMLAIVIVAYAIGEILRFNIRHGEPLLRSGDAPAGLKMTEHVANLLLALAYIVSVAFYLRLLASFVLKGLAIPLAFGPQILTTAILMFIGFAGWRRGLAGLVRLEEYSVSVKLAIIVALLVGLFNHDIATGFSNGDLTPSYRSTWDQARQLAGMLLVIQGFETSRYLGAEFSSELRIASMRFAQLLSGVVYVGFIVMITPLFGSLSGVRADETAIIDLVGQVAMVLPAMLVLAAVMSQFSAAVADTAGAGGLITEESRGRITTNFAYLAVVGFGVILVWTTEIFEIIALASRAFAAYYLAQAFVAFQIAGRRLGFAPRWTGRFAFGSACVFLAWVVVFAVPAG
jgi:hypothetical protein